MNRGEVWLVALDPTVGTEIQKTRPCLVLSPDELNSRLRRVIIAPMTSRSHPAPFRIATDFNRVPGLILLDQIRTVDKQRFRKHVGEIDARTLTQALAVLASLFS